MKALIIITKNYHEDPHAYEVPDVYTIEVDSVMDNNKTAKSRAEDIMTQLYKNYFEAEDMESAIPLDHKLSHYDRHHLYGQIVWVNGDIHQYYLVIDPPDAADELKKYHRHQKKMEGGKRTGVRRQVPEDDGDMPQEASAKTHQNKGDDSPMGSCILSLSTVHVHPDAVEFLSMPMNSDALQVFSNSDQCVIHITDAEAACGYDIAPSVKDCIHYADERGCFWLYLGYYGNEDENLPTYRTAWDKLI